LVILLAGLYTWFVERSQSGFYAVLAALVSIVGMVQGRAFQPRRIIYACFIFTYLIAVLALFLAIYKRYSVDAATWKTLFLILLIISMPIAYMLYNQARKFLRELESCI
jgi:predicted permease